MAQKTGWDGNFGRQEAPAGNGNFGRQEAPSGNGNFGRCAGRSEPVPYGTERMRAMRQRKAQTTGHDKRGRGSRRRAAAGALLALFLAGWALQPLAGRAAEARQQRRQLADAQERESDYLTALHSALRESGYRNAGVTMTRTEAREGGSVYTVRLHHRLLTGGREAERDALLAALRRIPLDVPGSRLIFEII